MLSSTKDLSNIEGSADRACFLGVTLDPGQRWDLHGDSLAGRLASCAYALRQLSRSVSREVLRIAYFGMFHSKLSYAILSWGHSSSRHRLFALQRRAVRTVSGAGYRDGCRHLFTQLGILTLPSLFALESLYYIRRNLHRYTVQGVGHKYDTRKGGDLSIEFMRLTRSRTAVSYHGIQLFNRLPLRVRELPLSGFRGRLKAYFLAKAFFSVDEILSDFEFSQIAI